MTTPSATPEHEGPDLDLSPCAVAPGAQRCEFDARSTGAPVKDQGSNAWILALVALVGMLVASGGLLTTGSPDEVCLLQQILERVAPTLVFDNPLV